MHRCGWVGGVLHERLHGWDGLSLSHEPADLRRRGQWLHQRHYHGLHLHGPGGLCQLLGYKLGRVADGRLHAESVEDGSEYFVVVEAIDEALVEGHFIGHRPIDDALVEVRGAQPPNPGCEHHIVAVVDLGQMVEAARLLGIGQEVGPAPVGDLNGLAPVAERMDARGYRIRLMGLGQADKALHAQTLPAYLLDLAPGEALAREQRLGEPQVKDITAAYQPKTILAGMACAAQAQLPMVAELEAMLRHGQPSRVVASDLPPGSGFVVQSGP